MECKLIGIEIISTKGEQGVILDKAINSCNGASSTSYVCMKKDGTVFSVYHNNIKEIKGFVTNPNSDFAIYLTKYKN